MRKAKDGTAQISRNQFRKDPIKIRISAPEMGTRHRFSCQGSQAASN
jgi:arginine/lysine/ornithine decarboxylase